MRISAGLKAWTCVVDSCIGKDVGRRWLTDRCGCLEGRRRSLQSAENLHHPSQQSLPSLGRHHELVPFCDRMQYSLSNTTLSSLPQPSAMPTTFSNSLQITLMHQNYRTQLFSQRRLTVHARGHFSLSIVRVHFHRSDNF